VGAHLHGLSLQSDLDLSIVGVGPPIQTRPRYPGVGSLTAPSRLSKKYAQLIQSDGKGQERFEP
jgi:hypothetical protein